MPEGGLSTAEVGKEISHHHHSAEKASGEKDHPDWIIAVIEASLLAIVAVLAAWSGYSSAKWSTESRLKLAQASTARTVAASDQLDAMTQRNFDASTFNTWFVAYVASDTPKMAMAERRFTPNFRAAFDAWMATNPLTNPNAPPGPTSMPQYQLPTVINAANEADRANKLYSEGTAAGNDSDSYVRSTVYMATVLFLIAISGHFRIRGARIGLIVVGVVVLTFAVINLATLPFPPA
jgi:hypothetical protein